MTIRVKNYKTMAASNIKTDPSGMTDADITEPFLQRLKVVIDNDDTLNVSNLAVRAGLSNSTIRLAFADPNRSLSLATARKICAALGTTLEEFMSDARSEEEREIVRLVMQLPVDLRQKLIGYGQGLLAASDQVPKEPDEEHE